MTPTAPATPPIPPRKQWLPARLANLGLLTAAGSLATACASYEPPKPGVYKGPGETAEAICAYETPTASRFMQMRCRSAEDVKRMAADARDSADSIRMPAPDIK
jgi:hypothetical protein